MRNDPRTTGAHQRRLQADDSDKRLRPWKGGPLEPGAMLDDTQPVTIALTGDVAEALRREWEAEHGSVFEADDDEA